MPGQVFRNALVVSLACWSLNAIAAESAATVVRSAAQLQTVLSSSQPTPLDALTPYGKRRFVESVRWGEKGLTGFNRIMLVRELEPEQVAEVLAFIGAGEYAPGVIGELVGPPLRMPAPTSDTEARLKQLTQFEDEDNRRRYDPSQTVTTGDDGQLGRQFDMLFEKRMSATKLRTLPLGDLPLYFDAASIAVFRRPDAAASRQLALVYEEMLIRGIDTRRTFDRTMLGHLLEARKFDEARAFAEGKPHLAGASIPSVRDPLGPGFAGRSAYRYDAATRTLVREALPQAAGTELVMVVDASCGFSARALAALHDDAALRARLQQAGLTLIVPPRAPIDVDYMDEWNRANPEIPLRVPYRVEEWRAVDVNDVPHFFLLKDGKAVGHVTGWPTEGNHAALIALLDRATR